jgi:cobalt/nickel transport system ATP-binding protein
MNMARRIISALARKKRIAIATVLSLNPELLVIDEPTNNLDPRSKWALIEVLRKLPVIKIIATHDLELVKALCQRTVVLDEGKIAADGGTEAMLSDIQLLMAHGLAPSVS